jgi:excisionase family DNA binding protein
MTPHGPAADLIDELLASPDDDLRPLASRLAPLLGATKSPEDFLTVAQAAECLEVHPNTVYRMILRGHLRAVRAGRLWRIPRSELGKVEITSAAPSRRRQAPLRQSSRNFGRLVRELPYAGQ